MNLRRHAVLPVVCAFLLLLAQQGALTHDIWHSAKAASQAAVSIAGDSKDVKKNRLCDFHAALGSVLGVLGGNAPAPAVADTNEIGFKTADAAAVIVPPLPPASRGPPALL
jgi:hypothetical protein